MLSHHNPPPSPSPHQPSSSTAAAAPAAAATPASSSSAAGAALATIKQALVREFGPNLERNPEILDKLANLCRAFNVAADDLMARWESHILDPRTRRAAAALAKYGMDERATVDDSIPTLDHVEWLRQSLKEESDLMFNEKISQPKAQGSRAFSFLSRRENLSSGMMFDQDSIHLLSQSSSTALRGRARIRGANKPSFTATSPTRNAGNRSFLIKSTPEAKRTAAPGAASSFTPSPSGKAPAFMATTPVRGANFPLGGHPDSPAPSTPSLQSGFANRPNSGKIEETLNPEVPKALGDPTVPSRVDLAIPPGQQMTGYRYMFDRGADRGDLIDSHIEEISRVLEVYMRAELGKAGGGGRGAMDVDEEEEEEQEAAEYGDVTGEDFEWKLLSAPSQPNNDVFYTAGRICCEDPTDGVKLNYDSLMLEPCRSLGGGVRVKLSVQQLLEDGTGFAVFPGQIVGVEASNPSGRLLLVKRIFLPPKQRVPDSSVQRILRLYSTPAEPEGRPVNIIIAAGPFTLSSNLLYEPLRELVKVVQKEGPDVVILMGPFVDKGHPGVGPTPNGVRAGNAEQILRNILKPIFEEILAARDGLKLVLIPSTRSRESEWVAYPQPPIGSGLDDADQRRRRAQFGLDHFGPNGAANSRVYLLPNPVQLAVNEVVVTLSNADTLMHIGSEECWRNQRPANADAASLGTGPGVAGAGSAAGSQTTTMDRMSRLFSHVLTQRHLYPLSPPSLGAPDAPFCLDFARAYGGTKPAALRAHPDVLVVPSGLRQSAKTVDGCVCLNPGQLVRGANDAAGTFARLCVHPLEMALLRRELEDARAAARGVANPRKRKARDAAGGGGGAGGMEVDGDGGREGAEEMAERGAVGTVEEEEEDVYTPHFVASRCRVEIQRI